MPRIPVCIFMAGELVFETTIAEMTTEQLELLNSLLESQKMEV